LIFIQCPKVYRKYILEITSNINLETENSQKNKFNVSAIQGAEIFSADDDCLVCDQSIKLNIEVDSKDLSLNNKYLKNFCVKTLKDNLKEIVIEAKGSGFDVGKKVVKIITNDIMDTNTMDTNTVDTNTANTTTTVDTTTNTANTTTTVDTTTNTSSVETSLQQAKIDSEFMEDIPTLYSTNPNQFNYQRDFSPEQLDYNPMIHNGHSKAFWIGQGSYAFIIPPGTSSLTFEYFNAYNPPSEVQCNIISFKIGDNSYTMDSSTHVYDIFPGNFWALDKNQRESYRIGWNDDAGWSYLPIPRYDSDIYQNIIGNTGVWCAMQVHSCANNSIKVLVKFSFASKNAKEAYKTWYNNMTWDKYGNPTYNTNLEN